MYIPSMSSNHGKFGPDRTTTHRLKTIFLWRRTMALELTVPRESLPWGLVSRGEIKSALVREGYSYITEETGHPASKHASAAWERLYNTFSMAQIFEYTFRKFNPQVRWWVAPETAVVQDPYRRIVLYKTIDEAQKDFENHVICSRRVLETAEGTNPYIGVDRNLAGQIRWFGNLFAFGTLCERRWRHGPL